MRIGVVGGAGKIGQLRIQSINETPQEAGAPAYSGGISSEPTDYKMFLL